MDATLLMIDWQKAIDSETYAGRGQPDAEDKAARLLAHWRESGGNVVHLRHDSMNPDSPYAPETLGNAFKLVLAPLSHEPVVEKRTNNGFIGTDLMAVLEEFQSHEIVICGVLLENSVEATVRMAGNLGFMVYLVGDACASLPRIDHLNLTGGKKWSAEDVHALTLTILDGEYAKVITTDALLATPEQPTATPSNYDGPTTLQ